MGTPGEYIDELLRSDGGIVDNLLQHKSLIGHAPTSLLLLGGGRLVGHFREWNIVRIHFVKVSHVERNKAQWGANLCGFLEPIQRSYEQKRASPRAEKSEKGDQLTQLICRVTTLGQQHEHLTQQQSQRWSQHQSLKTHELLEGPVAFNTFRWPAGPWRQAGLCEGQRMARLRPPTEAAAPARRDRSQLRFQL